ncbi:MAG: ATP-binding protein [Planctomycetes bacterium]|nr:ATP-binding protein [Planctomycetota bacterium]
MSIFNKPIDQITTQDVERFCSEGVAENVRVEYKREFSSRDDIKQVAKEVAAFANTQGGTILFGVEEDEKRKPKLPLTGIDPAPEPDDRITKICLVSIYPPIVPEVAVLPLAHPAGQVLAVVRVAESDQTPHTIQGRTEFYVRGNAQCAPRAATMEEIEWLQNRRLKAVEHRERLFERAERRCEALMGRPAGPTLRMSIAPLYPSQPVFLHSEVLSIVRGRNRATGLEFASRASYPAHESAIGQVPLEWGRWEFAAVDIWGLIHYSLRPRETEPPKRIVGNLWLLAETRRFLQVARHWYGTKGYWGPACLQVCLDGCADATLACDEDSAFKREPMGGCKGDTSIRIDLVVTANRLEDEFDDLTLGIHRRLRWAFGVEQAEENEKPSPWLLERVKILENGQETCPRCKRGVMSSGRAKGVGCEAKR